MSGYNFNFSGMFGGGFTNNLNKNNFDFSAYAPQKEEEVVVDPIDIVSNNTPEAKVEVLEGAADVAITKQPEVKYSPAVTNAIAPTTPDLTVAPADPITDAIQSVQPKPLDLGMDFSVTPETAVTDLSNLSSLNPQYSEAPAAISETGTYQSWENSPNLAASGTGFDVNLGQPDLYYDEEGVLQAEEKKDTPLSTYFEQKQTRFDDTTEFVGGMKSDVFSELGVEPLEQSLFSDSSSVMTSSGQANAVDYGFIENLNQMLESDSASQYAQQMTTKASDFFGETPDGYQTEYNALDYLKDLGVSNDNGKFTVAGKYGGYSVYDYDAETNQFVKTDDKESTFIDATLPVVAEALAMYVVTAGIGNAISTTSTVAGISGGSTAVANGIGQGIAQGASAALQGGNTEDILKSAALGGLDGYVEGLDLLTSDAEYMLGLADSGAELASHAETMNMVMDGVDLVTAIDEKDVLGALDAGLSLGGLSSTKEVVSNTLLGTFDDSIFVNRHSDVLAEVGIKATVDIAQGADAKEVIQNATNNTIKELVLTEENVSGVISDFAGDSEFVANNLDAITKTAIEASGAVLDGENRDKIIETAALTYIKEGGQLTPNTEGGANILDKAEDWYHENIENPLEEFWQEIEPEREVIENALGGTVKFVDEKVVQPVVNTVKTIVKEADQVVRDLPTTKEDWKGLEDDAKTFASSAAETVKETAAQVKEDYVDPVVDVVRDTGRQAEEVYGTVEDFVKEEVAPVINQAGRDVREAVEPVTTAVRETGRVIETGYGAAEDFVKEEVAPVINQVGRDIRDAVPDAPDAPDLPSSPETPDNLFSVSADPEITNERRGFYYDDSGLVSNPFLRGGEQQRIKSLTEMIQMEQENSARQAAILADEEERKLRYKTVYGVNPNVQVKYNG
jgi:hypothetical protein